MTKETTDEPTNVRKFQPKVIVTEPVNNAALVQGLEAFTLLTSDAKGFIAIVFDPESCPSILCAGGLDIVSSLGALELAKQEIFGYMENLDDGE